MIVKFSIFIVLYVFCFIRSIIFQNVRNIITINGYLNLKFKKKTIILLKTIF